MSSPIRTLTIAGTRPEIIKVAPVLRELQNHPREFDSQLLVVEQQSDICIKLCKNGNSHPGSKSNCRVNVVR